METTIRFGSTEPSFQTTMMVSISVGLKHSGFWCGSNFNGLGFRA